MLDKMIVGSDFARNHQVLSSAGWLMSYGQECKSGTVSEPDRWYSRLDDPTYSLITIYDGDCKLKSARLKRRKGTEL